MPTLALMAVERSQGSLVAWLERSQKKSLIDANNKKIANNLFETD